MEGKCFGMYGRMMKMLRGHGQLLFLVLARLVKTEEESEWQTSYKRPDRASGYIHRSCFAFHA
jgi:hypothetical protein